MNEYQTQRRGLLQALSRCKDMDQLHYVRQMIEELELEYPDTGQSLDYGGLHSGLWISYYGKFIYLLSL